MKYINSFNFKQCYLSHGLNARFQKEIVIPHLGSVTPDFQGVQVAFTRVIQFLFLQSIEVEKERYYCAYFTKSRVQCSEKTGNFLRVPKGRRFSIMFQLIYSCVLPGHSFILLHNTAVWNFLFNLLQQFL